MYFLVTDRLVVDDEMGHGADVARCIELINMHQSVAVGTFPEARQVLHGLGFTEGSASEIIRNSVVESYPEPHSLLPSEGDSYALPRE